MLTTALVASAFTTALIIIGIILIIVLVVLYFLGKRLEKKQGEQDKMMQEYAQTVSMLVIDKKKMKLKDAGFPSTVLDQVPKYLRRAKLPIVKVKAGPRIMSLICDAKIFDQILPNQDIKATVSGMYITSFKRVRGPVYEPPKTKKQLRAEKKAAKQAAKKK